MKTPFTIEEFFEIFEKYNTTVFPSQLVILLLGVLSLVMLHTRLSSKNKIIGGILGLIWIWIGLVYHILFFTEINKVAYAFGGLFIIEGILIIMNSLNGKLVFSYSSQIKDKLGYFLVLFGMFIYPVIGYLTENSFERIISLGLPCPSTIVTFGFFMLTNRKFPVYLVIIPTLWAIIGLSAAMNLGVYQDYMLIISAIIADVALFRKRGWGK